ncbi:MAG: tRNA (cytidine(34)-2'-O)-methyltransferase [Magnetovibrio sp.]|nr:tRNA (cytidine(34)-2'-O)-methyltransferase [Magnetovibrio sp.]
MEPVVRLALFEPDIPPNTAAVLRTCACLGVAAEIIEPCGFVFGGRPMRRAGMDYLDRVEITHHEDWAAFRTAYPESRRILLTTAAPTLYTEFTFEAGDILVCGRETAGVPDHVHAAADARVIVPMAAGMRSLNVAAAAAMVLGEALRQLGAFPSQEPNPE